MSLQQDKTSCPAPPRAIATTRRMKNGLIGIQEVPALWREAAGLVVCKGHKMEEFKHTSSPRVACTSVIPVSGPSLAETKEAHKESKVMFGRDVDLLQGCSLHCIIF